MIWNDKLPYHGFSNTKGETYLPFYDEVNKVSVESASKDDNSLYNFIKKMIKVRKENKELTSDTFDVKDEGRVLIFDRGNDVKVILNLSENDYPIEGKVIISSEKEVGKTLSPYTAAIIRK